MTFPQIFSLRIADALDITDDSKRWLIEDILSEFETDERNEGYEEGYGDGYREGYAEGHSDGLEDALPEEE